MLKSPAAAVALTFGLVMTMAGAAAATEAPTQEVEVALRTFIAHGDLDSRGLSCVVTNRSVRSVSVHVGYDGKHNTLVASTASFPVALSPIPPRETRIVVVEAGMSQTVFTLPLDAILLRHGEPDLEHWMWGWSRLKPRPAPPTSPIHPRRGSDWMQSVADHTYFTGEVRVDERVMVSPPLHYVVDRPAASPRPR